VAVIFDSVPNERLVEYSEREQCEKLLEESERNPLRYDHREFETPENAKKWYRDLTQGNGKDGKDLYNRCPGRCSPSYSSIVSFKGDQLSVSTSAICGHARNKDDDQYRMKTALKWVCP
jgi:hypothetical protein